MAPPRVLVVDDEPDVADLVAVVLQRDGLEVDAVSSGQSALDRLAAQPYDLIVCDLVMPGVDGMAVYRAVQQRPEPRPRMMFLSGYYDAGGHRDALLETGVPTVGKPFDPDRLAQFVRRLLAGT